MTKKLYPTYDNFSQWDAPLVEPNDEAIISLLGAYRYNSILITDDQLSSLARWLDLDPKTVKEDVNTSNIVTSGNFRNLFREVEFHGIRIMAFLAGRGLLEKNEDPIRSLASMLHEYLEEPYDFEE